MTKSDEQRVNYVETTLYKEVAKFLCRLAHTQNGEIRE